MGKYNIHVNAIALTSIKTRQAHPGKAGEELVRRALLGRMGEPEDVAGVALFLASNALDMMSGVTILVDGGVYCLVSIVPRICLLKVGK